MHDQQERDPELEHRRHGTLIIGYEEDGVMWLTKSEEVPDTAAAERYLAEWAKEDPGVWRAVEEVTLVPDLNDGLPVLGGDETWLEGEPGAPWARASWRLVNVRRETICFYGDDQPNPYYEPASE